MRILVLPALLALCAASIAPAAVAGDASNTGATAEPHAPGARIKPRGQAAKLPENRRDPEDRGASASTGSSAGPSAEPQASPDTLPGRGTDLGREAEQEDEAIRKQHQAKPSSLNRK